MQNQRGMGFETDQKPWNLHDKVNLRHNIQVHHLDSITCTPTDLLKRHKTAMMSCPSPACLPKDRQSLPSVKQLLHENMRRNMTIHKHHSISSATQRCSPCNSQGVSTNLVSCGIHQPKSSLVGNAPKNTNHVPKTLLTGKMRKDESVQIYEIQNNSTHFTLVPSPPLVELNTDLSIGMVQFRNNFKLKHEIEMTTNKVHSDQIPQVFEKETSENGQHLQLENTVSDLPRNFDSSRNENSRPTSALIEKLPESERCYVLRGPSVNLLQNDIEYLGPKYKSCFNHGNIHSPSNPSRFKGVNSGTRRGLEDQLSNTKAPEKIRLVIPSHTDISCPICQMYFDF